MRIDCFALTANNITYAAMGDMLQYWQFFRPPSPAGHHSGVGFWHSAESFHRRWRWANGCMGIGPWRAKPYSAPTGCRPPVQRWRRAPGRPACGLQPLLALQRRSLYQPDTEEIQALLRPLYITSWLIDDFLADQNFYGARTLLLSSASSKTAYGTAFQLAQRPACTWSDSPRPPTRPSAKAWAATTAWWCTTNWHTGRRYTERLHRLCRQRGTVPAHPQTLHATGL